MESKVERTGSFVLNEQIASRSSTFEEGYGRHRLAQKNPYRVTVVGKVTAAWVAAVQADLRLVWIAAGHIQADCQPKRWHLRVTFLAQPTLKRAGVLARLGIDAKID